MPLAWRFGRQDLGGIPITVGCRDSPPGVISYFSLASRLAGGKPVIWHVIIFVCYASLGVVGTVLLALSPLGVHRLTAGLALVVSMGMLHDGLSRRAECCVHCRCDARSMVKTVVI